MDARYTEEHKSDNVYMLLSEVAYNSRMAAENDRDSVNRSYPLKDRGLFTKYAKEYRERADWCIEQVQNIIGKMKNEASAPLALRAVPLETLIEALAPPVQQADMPHFTEEHCKMLDEYFYMIPKENPDWIPSADEM